MVMCQSRSAILMESDADHGSCLNLFVVGRRIAAKGRLSTTEHGHLVSISLGAKVSRSAKGRGGRRVKWSEPRFFRRKIYFSSCLQPTKAMDDSAPKPHTFLTAPVNHHAQTAEELSDPDLLQGEEGENINNHGRALQAHRLRFVSYSPAAITSLALCPSSFDVSSICPWLATSPSSSAGGSASSQLLAVGRANGDIQFFTTKDKRFLWSIPAPSLPGKPVENITWIHRSVLTPEENELFPKHESPDEREAYLLKLKRSLPRLVSSSGSQVLEYDWTAPRPSIKRKVQLPGGAICDMALDPLHQRTLAACNETGQIHLIDASEHDRDIEASRTLECSGGGKLLSLAWQGRAQGFVTGGADSSVKKWDLSGRCTSKMMVDRKKAHTMVWAVLVLP